MLARALAARDARQNAHNDARHNELIGQFRRQVGEELQRLETEFRAQDAKYEAMEQHMAKLEAHNQEELRTIKTGLHQTQNRCLALEQEQEWFRTSIKVLKAALAVAEGEATRMPMLAEGYSRSIDTGIIKIRSEDKVSQRAVMEAIDEVLKETRADPNWTTFDTEDDLSKLHVLRFTGKDGLAELRAKKFLLLQKQGKGWRKLKAKTPAETTTELYIGGDKNPKMVRTEIVTKKLTKILEEPYPGKIYGKRHEGKVFAGWIPLARVKVEAADQIDIEWSIKQADTMGITIAQRSAIQRQVREALDPMGGEDTQWG